MQIHEFAGSHREVGRQHGEELRGELRESANLRFERCTRRSTDAGRELSVQELRGLARKHLPYLAEYSPGLMEEIEGIAEGAGVPVEDVFITSGFTDFVDVAGRAGGGEPFECTALFAGPEATTDGSTYVGQTWDMFCEAAEGTIGLRLKVDGEPECFAIAYAGCVGMMGMNAEGVAVAANNLKPRDARPGVPWVFQCRAVLATSTAEEGFKRLIAARLCSGHHFLIADGTGALFSVETTGERYARLDVPGPTFAHANHYVDPELSELAFPLDPKGCSPHRENRMKALLADAAGRIDQSVLEAAFRDHDGRPRSICSHDYETSSGAKVRTCGAIIMNTTHRRLALIKGNPCQGEFITLDL